MTVSAKTKINMVIGDPVEHSIGPQVYNAVYNKLGIDDKFVYVAANVKPHNLKDAIYGLRAFAIRSSSITVPHKKAVMEYLDEIDETAANIGAVNTVINTDGLLKGYNTDWVGVIKALEAVTEIAGKKIAVIGAGGAARGALYGLVKNGGNVTIFNRTLDKAIELAEEFDCHYDSFENIDEIKSMDILFNATSVGLHPNVHESPVPKQCLTKNQIVFDAVYSPYETQLLKDAREKGATVIHGLEMFLYQGLEQFSLSTGQNAPLAFMREELRKYTQ